MHTPTLQQFQAWAAENSRLAYAVVAAQAFAQTKREQVDAYILPVFRRYTFTATLLRNA